MGVHDTVPSSPAEEKQDSDFIRKGILLNLKFGKENAIKSHELARLIGIKVTSTNQQIRKICKELLVNQHIPILSCKDGFFKAKDNIEIKNYVESLKQRIIGVERDLYALSRIDLGGFL